MNRNKPFPAVIRHVCLMGADFSTGNLGVGALCMGSLQCIYQAYPDVEISLLIYDKNPRVDNCIINGKKRSLRLINLRFSKKFYLTNNIAVLIAWSLVSAIFPFKVRKWLRARNLWLRDIMEMDLCFSIAGGDSFSDIYGLGRFFYVMLPQLLLQLLDKPLVQLPQTIGPFKRRWAAAIAGYILRKSMIVYSRDKEGALFAKKLVGKMVRPGQVRYSPDVAFVLEPHKPQYTYSLLFEHHSGTLVGLNVSGLLWFGGFNLNNMFRLNFSYSEFIYKLISHFLAKDDVRVTLIPHVFSDRPESDIRICKKLYQELSPSFTDRIILVSQELNQNEIKYLIGKCDFFIGSRMHACIGALSQEVPAVGIAYSKKFKGVFATLDAEELVVDPRFLTIDETLSACDRIFNEKEKWRNHLSRRVPEVIESVLGMLSNLNDISMQDIQ